jgi:hypothetical protein
MSNSYVLLEKIVVPAAGASSVTFANIPQTGYTDLVIKVSARDIGARKRGVLVVNFNGSSANLTYRRLYGVVAFGSPGSDSGSDGTTSYIDGNTSTANTFSNDEIYIPNYASSNFKSFSTDGVSESNDNDPGASLTANLWSNTAAITSITLTTTVPDAFLQFSTFYLYGVAALGTTPAIAPKATGGDVVMTDGTYWYHAFTSSGTFTPQTGLTCDYLVVAGGGGGTQGGGGGAGVLTYVSSSLTALNNYAVAIGAGGAGNVSSSGIGTSGVDSSFNSTTSSGGTGGRGVVAATNPARGGDSGANTGGAGGANGPSQGSGGGAGTAGNGTAGTYVSSSGNNVGGAGGVGTNTYSSWASATSTGVSGYYASGGGGGGGYSTGVNSTAGSASSGGGGAGGAGGISTAGNGTAGTVNTGGGGGGGGTGGVTDGDGGTGGSGIVIIRYAV